MHPEHVFQTVSVEDTFSPLIQLWGCRALQALNGAGIQIPKALLEKVSQNLPSTPAQDVLDVLPGAPAGCLLEQWKVVRQTTSLASVQRLTVAVHYLHITP